MWPDNETERDFLNFTSVADTVAEIIVQANGRPISIGVSGAWGVGKSSMIELVRMSLANRTEDGQSSEFVLVKFNAWLYQGYDDARAALLEVITDALQQEVQDRQTNVDKAKELLGRLRKRVNWLRLAKWAGVAGAVAPTLALGVPPDLALGMMSAGLAALSPGEKTADEASRDGSPVPISSPPKEIHAIRQCFEDALSEMGVKLVVLIDDLDRCLPPTTISTLEAIRLFLFLENTAFVIAADTTMIKNAVRQHFDSVDDELVTNYFDKLIQVPIGVPPLGTQEVRAYMMLLYVDNSELPDQDKEEIREGVCKQLGQSWQGHRVDRAFMLGLRNDLPADLLARFESADRLAPLMTTASRISGNPRLIKRFLNALAIRMAISRAHNVGVDEAVLAKMLLFERCGDPDAYKNLREAVSSDEDGKPGFLAELEAKALEDPSALEKPWNDEFSREWLALPPRLSDMDLRGVLYVSREHAPLITPEDRLSSEGVEVLEAILTHPGMAGGLHDQMIKLPQSEMTVIMGRLLSRAQQEQEWGTPPILDACLAVVAAESSQGRRLAAFLQDRPPGQIRPGIVPKIGDQPWAGEVFESWKNKQVSRPVERAIAQRGENGNVTI